MMGKSLMKYNGGAWKDFVQSELCAQTKGE